MIWDVLKADSKLPNHALYSQNSDWSFNGAICLYSRLNIVEKPQFYRWKPIFHVLERCLCLCKLLLSRVFHVPLLHHDESTEKNVVKYLTYRNRVCFSKRRRKSLPLGNSSRLQSKWVRRFHLNHSLIYSHYKGESWAICCVFFSS